jgi:hypothetical protein
MICSLLERGADGLSVRTVLPLLRIVGIVHFKKEGSHLYIAGIFVRISRIAPSAIVAKHILEHFPFSSVAGAVSLASALFKEAFRIILLK